jgi:hypothetical protein
MTWGFQEVATFVLVAGALAYLARRGWLVLASRKAVGCGPCSGCPAKAPGESGSPTVVSLQPMPKSAPRR